MLILDVISLCRTFSAVKVRRMSWRKSSSESLRSLRRWANSLALYGDFISLSLRSTSSSVASKPSFAARCMRISFSIGRRRKSRLLKCAVENFAELSGGAGTVYKLAIDEHGWRAANVQGLAFLHRFLHSTVILGLHASLQLVLIHFEFSCFINRDAIKR